MPDPSTHLSAPDDAPDQREAERGGRLTLAPGPLGQAVERLPRGLGNPEILEIWLIRWEGEGGRLAPEQDSARNQP
jgi:hypothetical protein